MKKALNIALLISFAATVLVPLTGVRLHKLASVLFLLLSIIHILVYRRKMGRKKYLLLGLILASFLTGLLGMILDAYPIVTDLHRTLSIGVVFFSAIHIFLTRKKIGLR